MRHVLAVIVLCGCGGSPQPKAQVAVENRGGAASTSCELPARLEFEARRYGNVDADDPDYQVWSSWRVGIQLATSDMNRAAADRTADHRTADNRTADDRTADRTAASDRRAAVDKVRVRGTLAMTGDELTWTFDIAGTLDRSTCRIDLGADTHEPINVEVDLHERTGTIRSIDDIWLLGPPFPAQR
jgi:hypothetical protein